MEKPNMPATDSRAALVVAFILTLAAGLAGGMYLSRSSGGGGGGGVVAAHSPLDELQLTADQTQQMKKIWESVRDSAQACQIKGQALRLQRDKAMEALLTDEQKERFEKTAQDYNAQVQALNSQREAAFQNAVNKTNLLLNDQQRKTYQRILKTRTGREPGQPLLEDPATSKVSIDLSASTNDLKSP